MSEVSKAQIRRDIQFLLAMVPMWANGDEDPTALEVIAVGGWDQVEATRKRIAEIRANLQNLPTR